MSDLIESCITTKGGFAVVLFITSCLGLALRYSFFLFFSPRFTLFTLRPVPPLVHSYLHEGFVYFSFFLVFLWFSHSPWLRRAKPFQNTYMGCIWVPCNCNIIRGTSFAVSLLPSHLRSRFVY